MQSYFVTSKDVKGCRQTFETNDSKIIYVYFKNYYKVFVWVLYPELIWWILLATFSHSLTLLPVVANFVNMKWWKKAEDWLKPWHMGTHLRVLNKSYLMNTNMIGFRWVFKRFCVFVLGKKVASALEGLSGSQIQRIVEVRQIWIPLLMWTPSIYLHNLSIASWQR